MTKFDFIILGVLLVFALLGFLRGFVTELFEAIAIIVSVLYGKILASKVVPMLPNSVPEYMRIPLMTFVLSVLLIFSIKAIGGIVRKNLVKKSMKGTDHFLGGFMGIGKGVVVVVCVMAILSLTPLARVMEAVSKPAPIMRWTMKQSKPVLQRYTQAIIPTAKTTLEPTVAAVQEKAADVPATLENLSENLSKADRAAIIKLLKDPAIAGMNLTEEGLLKLVHAMQSSQGGKAGK
jgi:membrane protein required for colicin V production